MKERVLTGRKFLLSLSALLALVFLVAFFSPAAAASRQIALIPAGGKVLLLEEWGGDCLFAYSGGSTGAGAVVVLDKATGEPKGSVSLSLFWAGLRDGSLFVAEDSNGEALLTQLSLPSLTTVSSRPLPAAADSFLLFDCNGQGRFYYSQDGNFLYTATSSRWHAKTGFSPPFWRSPRAEPSLPPPIPFISGDLRKHRRQIPGPNKPRRKRP